MEQIIMNSHKNSLLEYGFTIIDSVFDDKFVDKINLSLARSYDLCRKIQIKNGIDAVLADLRKNGTKV